MDNKAFAPHFSFLETQDAIILPPGRDFPDEMLLPPAQERAIISAKKQVSGMGNIISAECAPRI